MKSWTCGDREYGWIGGVARVKEGKLTVRKSVRDGFCLSVWQRLDLTGVLEGKS